MNKIIVVAGATGNLGGRIVRNLIERGAEVRVIVRPGSEIEKITKLEKLGAHVFKINMSSEDEISKVCNGASCVVSALQGLHDVIVDTQKVLLDAAIAAGVSRFIPSDYSTDFTLLTPGENRNFDLRREFHTYLDKSLISSTSIFNWAFAEILAYNTPMLDMKKKSVGYWGENPDWHLEFTTMDDTAAYTAAAALDDHTPGKLSIASFRVSPNEMVAMASEITHTAFQLIPMGSLSQFAAYIKSERAANPQGENELNPRWQSAQYMHGMFSVQHEMLDNSRYPDIKWTSSKEFITSLFNRIKQ
ncbi:MAG: NmrA family NAD(P)-binding protein [Chitinophagales bacterium]|uniref:NmrA family NAD(P)-binding protein n=1 Tax=Candidatus Opimibacter skivensis TaxID=2982028 RepID=A0A9D7XT84_9BACT|nr:NmrA family NAD(P)-binding protein [Candidatus Opimibacter skivensis]